VGRKTTIVSLNSSRQRQQKTWLGGYILVNYIHLIYRILTVSVRMMIRMIHWLQYDTIRHIYVRSKADAMASLI